MFDIIKLVFTRPLEAIVILLCVGYLAMHIEVFEVKKAQAITAEQHTQQLLINNKVANMSETLIRIDENVKLIKEGRLGPAIP
jgi:hypothetical protein